MTEGKMAISLRDLLSREFELADEYSNITEKQANIDYASVVEFDHELRIHFFYIENDNLESVIPKYYFPKTAVQSELPHPFLRKYPTVCITIPTSKENRKEFFPMTVEQHKSIGRTVRPFLDGSNISDINRLYIELYITGMICRYHPSKWMSLLHGGQGDMHRSIILSNISRIEQCFPRLAKDQLEGVPKFVIE